MEGMPRRPREEMTDGVFHVFARGNGRRRIFFGDHDRRMYLSMLAHTIDRAGWRCLAYCLMDNHVHLLVETPRPNLGYGMQRIHGDYGRWLNRRTGSCGHVFQGRYGAVRMTVDSQLWTTVRYIAHNPLEAGLTEAAADWPWSSHRAIVSGGGPHWLDTARLLEYFGGVGGQPLARYRAMIG
jgi:REP element-mobilizing transposase RayT